MVLTSRLYLYVGLLNHLICERTFLINELFNVPAGSEFSSINEQLCDGKTSNEQCCDCGNICLMLKTCCIDKLWNSSNPLPLQQYLEVLINETSKYKDTTCESVFPVVPGSQNMYMVSTCADGASKEDIEGCLNINSLSYEYSVPVFGNDSFLYKNSFCARCNFIESFELVNLTARCESNREVPFGPPILVPVWKNETTKTTTTAPSKTNPYENLESCFFEIIRSDSLSSVILRDCIPRYNYDRNIGCQSSNEYYEECLSYYGFVNAFGRWYANYHCYLCNATDVNQARIDTPDLYCPPKIVPGVPGLEWSFTLSFSSQTNLDVSGPGYSKSDSFCQDGEFYNIIKSQFQIFSCSIGYQKVGNTCEKIKASKIIIVENPSFDRCLIIDKVSLVAELNSTLANTTSLENEIENVLNISLNNTFKHLLTSKNVSFLESTINVSNTTLHLIQNVLIQPETTLWKTVNALYISAIPNHLANKLHGIDFARAFWGGRLCAEPITEINPQGNFTETCSYQINDKIIDYLGTSLYLAMQPGEVKRTVSICLNYYLHSSCRLHEIVSDYTIAKNKTLFTESRQYNMSQYIPTENGISICVQELKLEYKWYKSVLNAQKYISYTGTAISILCYIGIILIFTFVKELKNIASMTIVALSVTVLFADTVFLIATQSFSNEMACKIIAIVLHWALLAAQVWTGIIAFDVLSKFGSVKLALTRKSTKRFTRYCSLVYSVPSIIVVVAVTLNETGVYNIGYGESNTCFIHNFYPKLYFYIIPFTVTFVSTVLCCFFTILFISKQEAKSRELLRDSGRSKKDMVSIAFKLVLALGIIEIVGFIQISKSSLTESEMIFNSVFAVTYTILRSLRGAILFYIYILGKENMKDLKSRFKSNKHKTTTRSTELQKFNTATVKH